MVLENNSNRHLQRKQLKVTATISILITIPRRIPDINELV